VSLANQTFAGFEVVVVNDGGPSVESLLADLEPYVTVRYVHHPEARGRAAALNSGLAAARGPWVTYLDDDDIVYPVHLDVLFHAVRETGFRVAYSDTNRALCRGEARRNEVVKREPYGSFEFHPTRLLVANRLPIQTIIHAAGCVAAVGQFDEGIDLLEDWDFVIRLSRRFPFHHVRRVTSEYRFRVSAGAGNAMIAQREDVLASQLALYERYPVSDELLRQERSDQIGHLRTQIERIREIRVSALSDAAKALSIACLVSGVPIDEDEGASGSARRKEAER
jgi:glycosyltransferase involved in cell wall biosynthesis